MAAREELQAYFEKLLGSRNVYFQPPESLKLKYDCIVYKLMDIYAAKANNRIYRTEYCYTVTYIHTDPDTELTIDILRCGPGPSYKCSFDRRFISDNLYHDVYTLYF